mgnify:FL=1
MFRVQIILNSSHEFFLTMGQKLTEFLEGYIKKRSLFKNKKALQANYTPTTVPYRTDQINQIAGILAPSLRLAKPSNIFI